MNIEITNKAQEILRNLLNQSNYIQPAVRITFTGIRCGGPKLGFTIDEAKDTKDLLLDADNINILIDKNVQSVIDYGTPLVIDFNDKAYGSEIIINNGASCEI